jgi:hypothetical protein
LRLRIAIAFIFFSTSTFGQEIIKGIVVDSATFKPLPYVNIQLRNARKGTTSDHQGNFSILGNRQDTLILSIVGYRRLELPLYDYETGLIPLAEHATELQAITIIDSKFRNPYEGMFEDQNAALIRKKLPFYFSKAKKEKIKVGRLKEENMRVQTYVEVVINNAETKDNLKKKFNLTEEQYYATLTKFNERHYNVMYYLTTAELISFLNQFFESEH